MFIIIEGIDGAGKSKLIESLTKYYPNYKVANVRKEWDDEVDIKSNPSRKGFFIEYFKHNKHEKLIVDRFHISEVVYDMTLRHTSTPLEPFEDEIFGADINNVILINIDIHEAVAQARIKKRDGKKEGQNLTLERRMFSQIFNASTIPHKMLIYNDVFEILEKNVKGYIENVCGVSGKILER
jgi:thymidylate kinase